MRSAVCVSHSKPKDNSLDSSFFNEAFAFTSIKSESESIPRKQLLLNHSKTAVRISRIPEKPTFIVRTHVIVYKDISDVIKTTELSLNNFPETLTYNFERDLHQWTVVNIDGSSYCKFEINIYGNDDIKNGHEGLLIAVNRLKGDAEAFFPIYNEIKTALMDLPRPNHQLTSLSASTPPSYQYEPLSDSEATEALTPIIRMAEEKSDTSRKESARIFCDLSQNDTVQEQLAKNGCIPVLAELARSDNECTKRNAIFALSNLSATQTPKINSEIIGTGILSTLLTLATNGPYHDKQMRRAAAAILNNISKQFPDEVVSSIGKEKLHEWMRTVVDIEDSQLQTHAVKAKEYLAQRAVVV